MNSSSFENIIPVSSDNPDESIIARAAQLMADSALVAFPTETVYGLGANAFNQDAVANIFRAKERPSTNPIIVHVHDTSSAQQVVSQWPEQAERLAQAFWPGPMTLILPKAPCVPDIITAGGDTVAIRIPAHPVALALLRHCGFPVAAPSANKSSHISPSRAEHVARDFTPEQVPMILDAGPTIRGIESVVLDITNPSDPRILRPGVIPPQEFEKVLGVTVRFGGHQPQTDRPLRSPGLLTRHYAPQTPLILVPKNEADKKMAELVWEGKKVFRMLLPDTPEEAAATLYSILHQVDEEKVWDVIVADQPPEEDKWMGVFDRMRRAAAKE